MPVSRPRAGSEAVHLLVDSTGLKLCGPGEWLAEKHAARAPRSFLKRSHSILASEEEIVSQDVV